MLILNILSQVDHSKTFNFCNMKNLVTTASAIFFCIALLLGSGSAHAQKAKSNHGALVTHGASQQIGGELLTNGIINSVLSNGLFMTQEVYVTTPNGRQMANWTGDASAFLSQLTSTVYTTTFDIYDIRTVVDATTGLVTLRVTYTPEKQH